MSFDYIFAFKIVLLILLWLAAMICLKFIFNCFRVYKKLKYYEKQCLAKNTEFIHFLLPSLVNVRTNAKMMNNILSFKSESLADLIYLSSIIFMRSFTSFQGFKFSTGIIRRLLR